MRISHFILMLCYGVFAACSSATDEPKFPLEETATQEFLPLQGITYPIWLEVKHPFLIVQNMTRTDSIFHVYDLTNYELKSAFGQTGQGPGEFGFIQLYHTPFPDVFIGDVNTNMIYQFGINEEGQSTHKHTIEAKYKGHSIANAAFINDSLYVLADAIYMPGSNLDLLSLQNEERIKTKLYRNPDIMDPEKDPDMGYVYASENRIVLSYGYKKQIDFMDTDLKLIKSVKFKYDHPADINNENRKDVKKSYDFGYLGKRYLYALFLGRSLNEHKDQSLLEVFDLDGNPVARYHLDGVTPDNFVVDENTFTLYGVIYNREPEDCLPVYKLKGLS